MQFVHFCTNYSVLIIISQLSLVCLLSWFYIFVPSVFIPLPHVLGQHEDTVIMETFFTSLDGVKIICCAAGYELVR